MTMMGESFVLWKFQKACTIPLWASPGSRVFLLLATAKLTVRNCLFVFKLTFREKCDVFELINSFVLFAIKGRYSILAACM